MGQLPQARAAFEKLVARGVLEGDLLQISLVDAALPVHAGDFRLGPRSPW